MIPKGKPLSTPSDAISREKLAQYVYEYLVHMGAQKAAAQFLTEIRCDKPIPLSEAPGFLLQWWCVFFDLYSASPERSEGGEYTSEAKAFHEYGGMSLHGPPLPNHLPPVGGPRENGMMPMGGPHPPGFFPGPGMPVMPRLPPGRFPPLGAMPHPFSGRGYPPNVPGGPYSIPSPYPGAIMYGLPGGADRFPPIMGLPHHHPLQSMSGPIPNGSLPSGGPPQMGPMMSTPPMEGMPCNIDLSMMGGPSPRMPTQQGNLPLSNCSGGINGEDSGGTPLQQHPSELGGSMAPPPMQPGPGGVMMMSNNGPVPHSGMGFLPPNNMMPPHSSPSLRQGGPEGPGGDEWAVAQHRSPRNDCRSYMYSPSNVPHNKHGMVD